MKVIIAGSRGINSFETLQGAIRDSGFEITEVVHGNCANSPDMLGDLYGRVYNIPIKKFPAKWDDIDGKPKHEIGYRFNKPYWKLAGNARNKEMANYANALIALWDGESKGTKDMIDLAKEKGLEVYVDILKLKNNSMF